ncbi:hypothetical protein [Bradyrhizobium sp. McL0616]|uniref:hypothetical protein n=1 Tax=Bradyrhizobium sp. McL0616 TaxID=3415674 RepID=UPI003CEC1AB5
MRIEIAEIESDGAVIIEVAETDERHGRFVTTLDGVVILPSSHQPLLDAARVLLKRGYRPEQRLVMRHRGSTVAAMSGQIGELAKWTLSETQTAGPRFAPYRPFEKAVCRYAGRPPMRWMRSKAQG